MCHRGGKCGATERTRPIAEGVKEPDEVDGGLLSPQRGNKDGACGQGGRRLMFAFWVSGQGEKGGG